MPAVDPQRLKKLMILELLADFALRRRLSGAQLDDLVQRALTEKLFDLSASSDEFALYLDQAAASYWAEALERSGNAVHLFTTDASDHVTPEKTYGGYTAAELERMPPQDRLAIANRVEFDRASSQ